MLVNAVLAIIFLAVTPFVFGVKYLDSAASAFVLERFVALAGIILLTPLFFPEQEGGIAELVESKYTSQLGVIIIRLAMSLLFLFAVIAGMVFWLHLGKCEFDVVKFTAGTFATSFFLGSLGFAAYGITGNVVVGYLIPISYHLLNFFSGSKLGSVYLFSLSEGSFSEKYWLFGIGVLFIIITLAWRYIITIRR